MNTLRHTCPFLFCFALAAVFFTACKPKLQVVSMGTPVVDKENSALFADILENEFSFNTMSARLNMDLSIGTRSLSSRASLRIVRDRALQISVQPLFGVEVFRLHVDRDSLVVLDRMNKRYVQESLTSLKELYPVGFDYYALQGLFTNALFIAGKSKVQPTDYPQFSYTQTPGMQHQLKSEDKSSGIEYVFNVSGEDRITLTQLRQPQQNYSLQWEYTNFASVQDGIFPHRMNVTATSSLRKVDVGLTFSDTELNRPMQFSILIPGGYTKVSPSEILKILTSAQ